VIDAQHSFADRLPVRATVPRLSAPIVEVQPKAPQPSKAKKSNGNRPPEPALVTP
jgi:hypothetical protein